MAELKTLKDLKDEWKSSIIKESDLQSEAIEFSYTGELIPLEIIEGDLKQEAIKWIKEIDNFKKSSGNLMWEEFTGKTIEYSKDSITGLKNWIKHFFNITEEDLK